MTRRSSCDRALPGYDFADAYAAAAAPGLDAERATQLAFARGSRWIRCLMGLRNRILGLAGLKPVASSGLPVVRQSRDEIVPGI